MIWNQFESFEGHTVFTTIHQGEEFVVGRLEGEPGWWLIPQDPMKMRALADNATVALNIAKKYITANNN